MKIANGLSYRIVKQQWIPVAEPGVGECPAGQGCAAGQVQEESEASRSLA